MTTKAPAIVRWGTTTGERVWWFGLSAMGAAFIVATTFLSGHTWDLLAYYSIDLANPYAQTVGLRSQGAFLYSPVLALALAPLGALPWSVVVAGWLAAQLLALHYIAGRWALALVTLPPVWFDIMYGNINIFLAAMIVAGFRHPGAWTFGLLTKVTPGVGLLWFLVRREWRSLAIAGAVTVGLVTLSIAVLGTDVWADWFAVLEAGRNEPIPFDALAVPLIPRLVLAVAIIAWGAWTDRRWTVPVAVTLAMPVWWPIAFAPLVALAAPLGRRQE